MPDLSRFTAAQQDQYPQALVEVSAGRKRTHWMWFIFPQLAGLSSSRTGQFYAIEDLAEAAAYLADPVLGPRLAEISSALLRLDGSDATRIFGPIDALKLRSSMTLFAQVAGASGVFQQVLDRFFDGVPDDRTLQLLAESPC